MTISTVAGTLDGGRIRTIAAPWRDSPDAEAVRAVLTSWCLANGLLPARMLEREPIEIRDRDPEELARGRYEIVWREVVGAGAGGEARSTVRRTPLVLEPEGLLADELTCGHVLISPSAVLGAPALLFVCDQHIDPRTGRHPGQHTGDWAGEHRPPPVNEPVDPAVVRPEVPTYRMSWDNEHPGEQPFRDGMPYAGGLSPDDAHRLILDRLREIADRRPMVNRRLALIATVRHVRGLREIALRHEPHATREAGTVCNHDFTTGAGLTTWPCVEVRDALGGIISFAPAAFDE